jgi:hypothetical protein
MKNNSKHLLVGSSFTDPSWQDIIPWSVQYAYTHPVSIVAQAGMGIKGIATEALAYLESMPTITTLVIILPDLWRMDIEIDREAYLSNAMVDLIYADKNGWKMAEAAFRKWIISGGIQRYDKKTERGKIFDFLYKHQGFLVIAKEHITALKRLIDYCNYNKIKCYISASEDPLTQLTGLDFIRNDIGALLETVNYSNWFRFNGKFIDKFLGHSNHPSTQEHNILCNMILDITG